MSLTNVVCVCMVVTLEAIVEYSAGVALSNLTFFIYS